MSQQPGHGGRDMAAERAEIEQVIAGKTLCAVFAETASRLEELNALKWRTSSRFLGVSAQTVWMFR